MTQPQGIQYESIDPQNQVDIGHLRTLAICHYVWGGVVVAFSSIFLIHVGLGIAVWTGAFTWAPSSPGEPPPNWIGLFFVLVGGAAVALGWTVGILNILSGRYMVSRRRRVLSLVMAGINCASIPFGTLLGIFTFVVLLRPSVRAIYEVPRT